MDRKEDEQGRCFSPIAKGHLRQTTICSERAWVPAASTDVQAHTTGVAYKSRVCLVRTNNLPSRFASCTKQVATPPHSGDRCIRACRNTEYAT